MRLVERVRAQSSTDQIKCTNGASDPLFLHVQTQRQQPKSAAGPARADTHLAAVSPPELQADRPIAKVNDGDRRSASYGEAPEVSAWPETRSTALLPLYRTTACGICRIFFKYSLKEY